VVTTTTHKTLRGPRGGLILTDEELGARIDKALFPGVQGGPLMHTIAAKAVALREAATPAFRRYQERVVENAARLVAALAEEGLRPVSGGTDTHLGLLDTSPKELSGKKAERLLGLAGITVNKNTIPFDTRKPMVTSGIRVGSPAVTTRGMGPEDMDRIAGWMGRALSAGEDEAALRTIGAEVKEFCLGFPLFSA
jgi:glycine hydroxymethyltransferase